MKKIMILLAAVALLASCGPENDPKAITSLRLSKTEHAMAVGTQYRLNAFYEPETAQPEITWVSSDTNIVKVNGGVLTARYELGEANVTATCGEYTATCKVTVSTARELFTIGGFQLWKGLEELVSDEIIVDTLASGDIVDTKLYWGTYYIWDQDIVFDGSGLSGAGYWTMVEVPVEVIQGGQYDGYYIGGAIYFDEPEDFVEGTPYHVKGGYMADTDGYLNWLASYLTSDDDPDWDAYDEFFSWPVFTYYNITEGTSRLYEAFIKSGFLYSNKEDQLQYDLYLEWLDTEDHFYGLKISEDGTEIVEPLELVSHVDHYTVDQTASSAKKVAIRPELHDQPMQINVSMPTNRFVKK